MHGVCIAHVCVCVCVCVYACIPYNPVVLPACSVCSVCMLTQAMCAL